MSTAKHENEFDISRVTTYQAGAVQAAVHRQLQKQSDEILKPYGITKMHWLIIGTILDSGDTGARITDISKILDTTLPYLTNTLNILEARGIITRANNIGDSRSKVVKISAEFGAKCAEIENAMRDGLRHSIYSHISVSDFRTYMKVLYQLHNN